MGYTWIEIHTRSGNWDINTESDIHGVGYTWSRIHTRTRKWDINTESDTHIE